MDLGRAPVEKNPITKIPLCSIQWDPMENTQNKQVVIIGAGPAGLTAGYELTKHNVRPIVLEQQDKVGGLARTENYKGYYFDMGGHRFFTKSESVNQMWR